MGGLQATHPLLSSNQPFVAAADVGLVLGVLNPGGGFWTSDDPLRQSLVNLVRPQMIDRQVPALDVNMCPQCIRIQSDRGQVCFTGRGVE